jgi:hypothetical protein
MLNLASACSAPKRTAPHCSRVANNAAEIIEIVAVSFNVQIPAVS